VEIVLATNVPQQVAIAENTIAFNRRDGIAIDGQRIRVTRNAIFDNGELGINLAPDLYTQTYPGSVTPNDARDADTGPNGLQNCPVITSATASASSTIVQGRVDTPRPQTVTVEVFSDMAAEASGFGEGRVFRGTVTPDAIGAFVATLPVALGGQFVTATATDVVGNTSEFSRAVLVAN
jgi:hypothetical protein